MRKKKNSVNGMSNTEWNEVSALASPKKIPDLNKVKPGMLESVQRWEHV